MCGRYALAGDFSEFTTEFGLEEVPGLTSRYNIAPSANAGYEAPIVTSQGLVFARFWYIPEFWDGPLSKLPTSFNARVETAAEKPFFRGASACLIPTSGFREFPGPRGKKGAVTFYRGSAGSTFEGPVPPTEIPKASFFAFAGIHSQWSDPDTGELADTFAIVTTEPSPVVSPHHDRMPLIVARDAYQSWLDPRADLGRLLKVANESAHMQPLSCYKSSTFGNRTRVEGPECIQPAREQLSLF